MELTIAFSISPDSKNDEILETLDSLPWDTEGIDLIVYSEDTGRIKKILKEGDLESTLLNGQMGVLFCEEPYSSDDTYMNIGVEDCKTDYITFLKPGDTIESFDPDLLRENFDVGFGEISGKSPITTMCYDSRMLPLNESGIIFSTNFLKMNCLEFGKKFIPFLINTITADLESPEYCDGWGKYDISEMYSVSPKNLIQLENEHTLPEVYVEIWKNYEIEHNEYLRDLLWNRIMRASGFMICSYSNKKNVISKFFKYLLPENKVNILS